MTHKKALIMVDLQNDFCEGGSLAVPGASEVVAIANKLQSHFNLIIATQDWHPQDHMSFASNHVNQKVGDVIVVDELSQVLWPVHCVQGTDGAAFHPALDLQRVSKIFHKGIDKKIDSYSAFFDNAHLRATGLADYLSQEGVDEIYIMGLATDYCVKFSTLDAIQLGLKVHLIKDACRGVDLNPGDVENAIADMREAGAEIVEANDIFLSKDKR